MQNPYLSRTSTQSHGTSSEVRVAKKLKARRTPASGAMDGAKGDANLNLSSRLVKLECKATIKNSMSLQYEWLLKISKEALDASGVPALTISFVMPDGTSRRNGDWVMVPLHELKHLLEDRE